MAMGLSVLWMLASVADAACLSGAIPWDAWREHREGATFWIGHMAGCS